MKLMLCYDGSDASNRAMKMTIDTAKACETEIHVVISLKGDTSEQIDEMARAEERLKHAKNVLSENGLDCQTKLLSSNQLSPGENLVEFARRNDIEEIFIGVSKTSKVGKFVFGSTAQHIILTAPCPVISVK